jgi:hypothetical protein
VIEALTSPQKVEPFSAEWLERWYDEQGVEEHPVVARPTHGQVLGLLREGVEGKAKFQELLEKRRELIRLMEHDPLRYGWEPDCWKDARALLKERPDLLVMGGNRSAKTEFAAKEAILDMTDHPERIWGFLHSSEDSSKRLQHPRLYRYVPREWRDLGKVGKTVHVVYTEQRGFADNVFILPNGSRGFFFNYKQDPKVLEGYEFDGVWADELIPPEFLVALRYRLITRRGRFLTTFTPVEGYTPTVGDYLAAAKVRKSLRSELLPGENVKGCPAGEMPYIMECVHPKRAIIFFFTEMNRFNPYDEMKRELETESTSKKKMRAYGYPDRAKGNVFPKFGQHNIIAASKVPPAAEGTDYNYADFAWARNWFILWGRVTEYKGKKRVIIWKEWPDFATYGEWAVPSKKPDGDKGPAQRSLGFGFKDYKKLIRSIERRGPKGPAVTIFERRCDPRSGKAEVLSEEGGTCIIDAMREDHCVPQGQDGLASVAAGDGSLVDDLAPMDFVPASGDNINEGVNAINAWLEYDENQPLGPNNEPVLYVSEECRNLIDCLRMWTGADGQKGAAKDPIDVLRYMAVDDIQYCDPNGMVSEGGGSY